MPPFPASRCGARRLTGSVRSIPDSPAHQWRPAVRYRQARAGRRRQGCSGRGCSVRAGAPGEWKRGTTPEGDRRLHGRRRLLLPASGLLPSSAAMAPVRLRCPPLFALPEIVSFGEARPGCRAFSPECPSGVSGRGLTCTGGPWPSWPAFLHAPDRVVRLPESLRGLHLRRHAARSCPWDTLNKSSRRSHPQSRARPSTRLVQSIPCSMVRQMVSPTTRNGLLEN